MTEISGKSEPKPQDPELIPCQVQIKELCDEILGQKPEGYPLTFWDIPTSVDGNALQEKLKASSLSDLLLNDGDTLSMPGNQDYYPDLGLIMGDAKIIGVSVRAWGWEYDKYRIDPHGPDKPPYDIVHYPGEKDWSRQLDISLHYSNGKQTASQTLTTHTSSTGAGHLPSVSRDVSAQAYAETGYEGHNQEWRGAQDANEIEFFVAIARELVEHKAHE